MDHKTNPIILKPFPQSYWVREGLLCAGHYPGSLESEERTAKLNGLLDCGIRRVVNLIPLGESGKDGAPFSPYQTLLQEMAAQRGAQVECLRMGFPDGTVPERSHMSQILNVIDASLAAGEPLYLHCWGGHGRTGTTAACYLIRHTPHQSATLSDAEIVRAAVDQILLWRKPLPRNHFPFEGRQEAFVRSWQIGE